MAEEMKEAYMVVGCPGSGKTWVCEQVKDAYTYVHHDLFIGMAGDAYVRAIIEASKTAKKPLLIEAPFSISAIAGPLEEKGFKITKLFIQEKPEVISERYRAREKKAIPKGHLTRQKTYAERARATNSFQGTSSQVYEYLKKTGNL